MRSPQTTPRIAPPPPIQALHGRPCRPQVADDDSTRASRLVPTASIMQGERLLRLRDVLIVGLSRAHVYNLIKQQVFPRPISVGSNCARWVQSEVQTWVDDSIAAARLTPAQRRSSKTDPR